MGRGVLHSLEGMLMSQMQRCIVKRGSCTVQSKPAFLCRSLAYPQAGVRAARPEHKWVLCLDDDIELHPRSLADLVAAAEADPHIFMATGVAPGHAC